MKLSWNEIRNRAIQFSKQWANASSEAAEKQTFWNEFFEVFGLQRKLVASFEAPVKKLSGNYGAIDLFWKGRLLVEHKSLGEDLDKAESQAFDYIQNLINEGRNNEVPQYVILSDFRRFALFDLEPEAGAQERVEFPLKDLHKHIHALAFIPGYKQHKFEDQDPINIKAVEIMGRLHDALEAGGYKGHELERFLVRVLFCLFAEDTGIFERDNFTLLLENRTAKDGSDLGLHMERLFAVLNTSPEKRQSSLDETLASFPYVNGDLFAERLGFAEFNTAMRDALLACTDFDWSRISPAVFGALFQSIMLREERRQIGAHYTSERDILKVVRSLFLDDLRAEFATIKADRSTRRPERLKAFHEKLAKLRFLDPACGCGNFLVITYRELRRLEIEVLQALFPTDAHGLRASELDVQAISKIDVHQFYGIEIEEWPARIAEVALWLMDHQMNLALSEAFGQLFLRLPLRKSPHIHVANALRTDWRLFIDPKECNFVLGNPPFIGKKEQNAGQKADMALVWGGTKGTGVLDYVTGWYRKAAQYTQGTRIQCAFVSTNSITQGEQVGVLWDDLFGLWHQKIHFAHRTFAWTSEARGKAHVHVVIIGFGSFDRAPKHIYDYDTGGEPARTTVTNINPYLVEGSDTTVRTRTTALNGAPEICYGSMMIDKDRKANDEAGLILTSEHRTALLAECTALKPYIRRLCGGDEFLNGTERWCLWLVDAPPQLLRQSQLLRARIKTVKDFRERSNRAQTKALAASPTLFGEIRQPTTRFLLIPKVSSENRAYIPIGFLSPEIIASGSSLIVPGAGLFHFGVLSSSMHNAWMRCVAGRLESRYQYSNNIVYNNYPWPISSTPKQRDGVEKAAQAVLDARAKYGDATLAELYDQLAMPPELLKAHQALDRAVERCYRPESFSADRERVEFLFAMYEKLTVPLALSAKPARKRRAKS